MVPKCTSWLGHKFVARYSTKPHVMTPAQIDQMFWLGSEDRRRMTRPIETYERDICVRCGCTLERPE